MLLFDLDGTLIDSNGIWEDIDLQFLGRHGLVPTEEYAQTVGHSIFPIAAQFTRDYYHLDMEPEAIMAEWMEGAGDAYAAVDMKPGALAFLRRCRDAGERMALVTACVPTLCRTALARHGLEPFFEDVIFAQEMGLEKRDPEVFRRTAERLGVDPAACTLYEDAPANCASAKSVGIAVVGVYDYFYAKYREEMERICDRYIESFEALL
ncbi:MAG TPA: HAD family phosphatase [Candidatus Intestinimonas stercoravium]|nr:HAD family phosphatase [Candidatus Intestinimonas stercoravium]